MYHPSLISAPKKGKQRMTDTDQLPFETDDPLLKIQFHEPEGEPSEQKLSERAALFLTERLRKAEGVPAMDKAYPAPAKKQRLGSSPAAAARSKAAKPMMAANQAPLLHQSCRLFPQCASVIESSVEMEPQTACERAKSAPTGSAYLVGDGREPYSLPINILLQHDASLEALMVMATAAPKALALKDGRDECCSLNIALRLHGNTTDKAGSIPEELLSANQEAAQVHDKRRNFPLHVATYVGASFDMVNKLYWAYPDALLETNFYGETPLDIAVRNGNCEDQTTNFLHEKMEHLKTARLRRRASLMI